MNALSSFVDRRRRDDGTIAIWVDQGGAIAKAHSARDRNAETETAETGTSVAHPQHPLVRELRRGLGWVPPQPARICPPGTHSQLARRSHNKTPWLAWQGKSRDRSRTREETGGGAGGTGAGGERSKRRGGVLVCRGAGCGGVGGERTSLLRRRPGSPRRRQRTDGWIPPEPPSPPPPPPPRRRMWSRKMMARSRCRGAGRRRRGEGA